MNISLKITNKRKFVFGISLIILSLFLPFVLNVENFYIYEDLYFSLGYNNQLLLVYAAFKLILLNSLRALPHYLGSFFLAESLYLEGNQKLNNLLKHIVVITIIPFVYILIYFVHGIRYHFGMPAITIMLLLVFLGNRNYNYVSPIKKSFLIILIVSTIQILDLMPALNFLPVGQGAMSREIKIAAKYLNMESILNNILLAVFLIFSLISVMIYMLIRDENALKSINFLKEENIRILNQARIQELENRDLTEMRNLVHDLKSPITAAQALVSLVKISCENKNLDKEAKHLNQVENSLDEMSNMITELLNMDKISSISVSELVDHILSNASIHVYSDLIEVENNCPNALVKVNAVFFTRAIINLFQNSYDAIKHKDDGKIFFLINSINRDNDKYIEFSIIDNGIGIDEKYKNDLWKSGFSTKNTSGLGLSFVRNVIDTCKGEIYYKSDSGIGTSMIILLKEV